MNTKTFHENFTVDRTAKSVRATAKNTPPVEPDILTADDSRSAKNEPKLAHYYREGFAN